MAKDTQHKFGGPWTAVKLDIVANYLGWYATALKNWDFELIYIDAFAGSGDWVPESGDAKQVSFADFEDQFLVQPRKGSARRALETPGFHRYIFIENNSSRAKALREVVETYQKNAEVIQADANEAVRSICASIDWHNKNKQGRPKRAVLFLDPYGMTVEWETLAAISQTRAIDLWYLFPINALLRQAAHKLENVDEDKRQAMTRLLGTADWEKEFYTEEWSGLLNLTLSPKREADVVKFEKYFKKRLSDLFAHVLEPVALPQSGLQKFSLFFAISNPSKRAVELAERIAKAIIKSA